jgi:hypothetical protein
MGSAHGFASTVVLSAESPAHAGGFWQSNAFWGGLSVLNRSVGCVSLGVAQCWYIGGPLALKRNGAKIPRGNDHEIAILACMVVATG